MRHPYLRSADRAPSRHASSRDASSRDAFSRAGPVPRTAGTPLVAVAHGSSDPRAGSAIAELITLTGARAARHGLAGIEARAAFLGHAPPSVSQVLSALAGSGRNGSGQDGPGQDGPVQDGTGRRPVVVLPLLLTAAYHSGTDIPEALREAQAAFPRLRIAYGEPLGPHPALLRALERRLAEAGEGRPESSTAVVLAAAGSSQPAANAAVARMAASWQSARRWRAVVPAYASAASPTPDQAVAALLRAGAPRVVVASYLLAPGLFADRIRDASLAAGAAAVSRPLGAAPEVADVLLQRYTEARDHPVVTSAPWRNPLAQRA
jgi:sirohydrochlorin ferrochelatase